LTLRASHLRDLALAAVAGVSCLWLADLAFAQPPLPGIAARLPVDLARAPRAPAPPAVDRKPDSVPKIASYTLTARLDPGEHRIDGRGVIEYWNTTRVPLRELYFHLYLNAFKHEKSLFLRSPFGEGRGGARAEDWGYIDVKSLKARELGGVDLWPQHHNASTEEPDDETDVRVPLPRVLEPGARLTLDVEFSSKLPRVILRTGYAGNFHLAGQWFPKLALVADGGIHHHFPFHPQAEFFADYGSYDVTVDVPDDMLVGATGSRVESRTSGGRRVERYRADAVHDFAFTAWNGFRERNHTIDGVAVRILYPADHEQNAERTLAAVAATLPRASRLYGRYPYPTLTVVHPPADGAQAGGMEYPTLITTGGYWFAGLFGDRSVEAVTIHELYHQWFYGLVATDESRSPFLDEGLTSYAELRTMDTLYGPGSMFRGFGLELSATGLARAFAAMRGEDAPLTLPAREFPGFRALAALVYSRTATLIETLARVYGRDALERGLGVYARRHRFEHPRPADLIEAIEGEVGSSAARVLELGLHHRGRVDFLVRDLEHARERSPGGVFDHDGKRETAVQSKAVPESFRSRAVIYRHGSLVFPVEIALFDEHGAVTRQKWDGVEPFHVVEHRGPAPITRIVVDPDQRVMVDEDLLNNASSADRRYPLRTLERASYLATLALSVLGP
jgi:hypothetical protein